MFDRLEEDMVSIRALEHTISISAPAGVMHYTLGPALLGNVSLEQPFHAGIISHPLPPLDLLPEGPADIRVVLTPKNETPQLEDSAIVQRVGTMHFLPFIAARNIEPVRIESREDLKKFTLCQRSDYADVPSMAAWNDVCESAHSTIHFTNSVDMHRSVLRDRSVSIFPSYSHFYEKDLLSCEVQDLDEISLSIWLSSSRDGLKDPPLRRVFDTVSRMFSTSPWYA
jgi:hypothetical protein